MSRNQEAGREMSHDERAYELDTLPAIRRCLRCGAYVGDPERHDRWHAVMDK